jgi:hypothetical protein
VILVDTSVWIDHFRQTDDHLLSLLDAEVVVVHPFVLGELALGYLHPRAGTLLMLGRLPRGEVAGYHELLQLIEHHRIFGKGVGFVDAHLLATSKIMTTKVWTHDKRLHAIAESLGVAYRAVN